MQLLTYLLPLHVGAVVSTLIGINTLLIAPLNTSLTNQLENSNTLLTNSNTLLTNQLEKLSSKLDRYVDQDNIVFGKTVVLQDDVKRLQDKAQ